MQLHQKIWIWWRIQQCFLLFCCFLLLIKYCMQFSGAFTSLLLFSFHWILFYIYCLNLVGMIFNLQITKSMHSRRGPNERRSSSTERLFVTNSPVRPSVIMIYYSLLGFWMSSVKSLHFQIIFPILRNVFHIFMVTVYSFCRCVSQLLQEKRPSASSEDIRTFFFCCKKRNLKVDRNKKKTKKEVNSTLRYNKSEVYPGSKASVKLFQVIKDKLKCKRAVSLVMLTLRCLGFAQCFGGKAQARTRYRRTTTVWSGWWGQSLGLIRCQGGQALLWPYPLYG